MLSKKCMQESHYKQTDIMTSSSCPSCAINDAKPLCNSSAHKSLTAALDLMLATSCAMATLSGGVTCPAGLSCSPPCACFFPFCFFFFLPGAA